MYTFSQVRIGALAAVPTLTASALKPGYEWFPYTDSKGNAMTVCPSLAVQAGRGCWTLNGRMWGQRLKEPADVLARPAATKPTGVDCNAAYLRWLDGNRSMYSCATTPAAKSTYLTICSKLNAGTLSMADAGTQWSNWLAHNCASSKPPPLPPAYTPPPSNVKPPPTPHTSTPTSKPGTTVVPQPTTPPLLDDAPPPVTQTKSSPLQQLGPIVGIGLLAAVGLTLYRKRKSLGKALTKHRRRR